MRTDAAQVGGVLVFDAPVQELCDRRLVLLLEHLAVAHRLVAVGVGNVTVLGHLVDEEERQTLDATEEQRRLLLQVALDRLADLDAPDVVLG